MKQGDLKAVMFIGRMQMVVLLFGSVLGLGENIKKTIEEGTMYADQIDKLKDSTGALSRLMNGT